mgnify:CR=1 FL=1
MNGIKRKKIDKLKLMVANACDMTVEDMHHKSRKREIVEARYLAMWFMVRDFKMTLAQAGFEFRKDHATVLHGVRLVDLLRKSDSVFAWRFDRVANLVRKINENIVMISKEEVLANCTKGGMTTCNVLEAMERYAGQFNGDIDTTKPYFNYKENKQTCDKKRKA